VAVTLGSYSKIDAKGTTRQKFVATEQKMADFGGCAQGKNRPLFGYGATRSMSGKREISARLSSHRLYYVKYNTENDFKSNETTGHLSPIIA